MLPTHVIVLAQGSQKRLTGFSKPKQILPLAKHDGAQAPNRTILSRTLMQVAKILLPEATSENVIRFGQTHAITVVTWPAVSHAIHAVRVPHGTSGKSGSSGWDWLLSPEWYGLKDPGNSSIRGLARFLDEDVKRKQERTVVLLGDVLYSWACLETLLKADGPTFAVSKDLSPGAGELWGVSWGAASAPEMRLALNDALRAAASASLDEYQPGQLRHWLWKHPVPITPIINDYTMDVDVIEDVIKLAERSFVAYEDDRERGCV